MVSLHQYGKYKSSENLSKILNGLGEDLQWVHKKFSQIYSDYRISQKELEKISDKRSFLLSHLLFRNYALNTVYDIMIDNPIDKVCKWSSTPPEHVEYLQDVIKMEKINSAASHFENVICTDYKEALRKRNYI